MRGESGSPFNVREAVPVHFFTEGEVSELLGQFASARGISLEAGVAADIHELTAGHAGLVCACGGVLDSGIGLQQGGRVSLAAWQDFRVRSIIDSVVQWPTIGNMADSVSRMIPSARKLLVEALLAGSATLQLSSASTEVSEAARYLASEGWLVAAGAIGTDCFRLTSPLVRSLAMRQLAKDRRRELTASLPFADNGQLDVPTALSTALTCFRPVAMRSVSAFSTKISLAPAVFATPDDKRVPSEAVYHYELFSVFRQWLGFWQHAQIYPEADVAEIGSKRYADLLIGPSGSGPRHILELVASSGAADVREHYSRTIKYMVSHGTDRGACITFTAVAFASDTSVPAARLEWPAKSQLDTGLVAVHVVHDLGWTAAQVYWKSAAGKGASKVDLTVKQ